MENTKLQKETDYRFKLLYAIGIILVVCGHCGGGGINILYDWISAYSYHLALFVFSSGYFYKSKNEKQPLKYCLQKIKNLLVPLFLWNFFYALVVFLLSFNGFKIGKNISFYTLFIAPITNGHQFAYNLGGWFVIPLFMIEVFNVFIRKLLFFVKASIKDLVVFAMYLLLGIIGTYLSIKGFNNSWRLSILRFIHFLPFYALGILYKSKLEKYDNLPNHIYFGIFFTIQLLIICIYKKLPSHTPSWCIFGDGFIIPYIQGFIGISFWFRICKILESVCGKNKIINSIADNTFSIMINHLMGFMIVKTFFAFCCKYFDFFTKFDFTAYKTNIWYIYMYENIHQTRIIYVIFAIWFSIMVQKLIDLIKSRAANVFSRKKDS
ncbi:MAG: acyltransferase [Treponemataceae bacterium]|nr:acyltransferase [Treponemataceae bacterium]